MTRGSHNSPLRSRSFFSYCFFFFFWFYLKKKKSPADSVWVYNPNVLSPPANLFQCSLDAFKMLKQTKDRKKVTILIWSRRITALTRRKRKFSYQKKKKKNPFQCADGSASRLFRHSNKIGSYSIVDECIIDGLASSSLVMHAKWIEKV